MMFFPLNRYSSSGADKLSSVFESNSQAQHARDRFDPYIHVGNICQRSIHLSINEIFISHPSICDPPSTYPPIHLYTHLSIHPSTHPSLHPSISAQATQCYWVARALCESAPREKSGKFAQKSKFKFSARNFLSLGKVCDHFCENAKHTDQREE